MNTAETTRTTESGGSYLTAGHTLRSWLCAADHKRVAVLYLVTLVAFFVAGGLGAAMLQADRATGFLSSEIFNRTFSAHGILMVFFFLIPAIPGVLGNFLVPLMIGSRNVALPRLNLLAFNLFATGGVLELLAIVTGGIDTGWTFSAPYSTSAAFSQSNVILAASGVLLATVSAIFSSVNLIVTVNRMRCPGMTWFRLPLFVWSLYAASVVVVLSAPAMLVAMAAVLSERLFGATILSDPLILQQLFWFYARPAGFVMLLPAIGAVCEIVPCFSRRRIGDYRLAVVSIVAAAVLGFFASGHATYASGQSQWLNLIMSFFALAGLVPLIVLIGNWILTLRSGSISFEAPMVYALGFILLLIVGVVASLPLYALGSGLSLSTTLFATAQFHILMVGGGITGLLAGLHYWWPKITGRLYNDGWARFAAGLVVIGLLLTFLPMLAAGVDGMQIRHHHYSVAYQPLLTVSAAGGVVLCVGILAVFGYLTRSLVLGPRADANPWQAFGLEWKTSSPPPATNFVADISVHTPAYAYDLTQTERAQGVAQPVETPKLGWFFVFLAIVSAATFAAILLVDRVGHATQLQGRTWIASAEPATNAAPAAVAVPAAPVATNGVAAVSNAAPAAVSATNTSPAVLPK